MIAIAYLANICVIFMCKLTLIINAYITMNIILQIQS